MFLFSHRVRAQTNRSPLKIGHAPKGFFIFEPWIFRGEVAVRFREAKCWSQNVWIRTYTVIPNVIPTLKRNELVEVHFK